VRFGAAATRVTVRLRDPGADDEHELSVGFASAAPGAPAQKRMTSDGARVERLLDAEHRPLVSVFMPDRLELVKGPPAPRRAHLDQLVAALWPLRAATRREYSRVLSQRNALLGRLRTGAGGDATLAAWDRELAEQALALRADRAAAIELLTPAFAERAARLGCTGELTLEYRSRSRADDADTFCAELRERLATDLERGFTGHGPHRDELAILRDGRELRTYGSQGEQRLALLALLLGERTVLAQERGCTPLMLLDDVMSELDRDRRELLAGDLVSAGQSVIATTDLAHVPGASDPPVTRLRIAPGAVLGEALAA
jgi:DNA replication and repair protein RecF